VRQNQQLVGVEEVEGVVLPTDCCPGWPIHHLTEHLLHYHAKRQWSAAIAGVLVHHQAPSQAVVQLEVVVAEGEVHLNEVVVAVVVVLLHELQEGPEVVEGEVQGVLIGPTSFVTVE